jgi:hypothetical protein
MPACAETSVNSIGPDGRGAVGLGDGEGAWFATSAAGAFTGATDCLQDENSSNESSEQKMIGRHRISF